MMSKPGDKAHDGDAGLSRGLIAAQVQALRENKVPKANKEPLVLPVRNHFGHLLQR